MKVLGAMVMERRATLKRFSMARMDMTSPHGTGDALGKRVTRDSCAAGQEWMVRKNRRVRDGIRVEWEWYARQEIE
jgi:hypothetical protein